MGKNQSASNLPNIIQYSNGSINFVSGSTLLMQISSSGAITTTGVISGSNALSSSYSVNSDQLDGFDSTAFVFTSSFNTYSSSMSTRVSNTESTGSTLTTASASFAVVSSSYSTASGSLSTRVTKIEGNYATTGSNVFLGAQTVCANITSTGTIIAQTLNVQQVTSSIVYSSGSNTFGCSLSNVQQFTGSVFVTGSTLTVAGGNLKSGDGNVFGRTTICTLGTPQILSTRNGSVGLSINSESDCTHFGWRITNQSVIDGGFEIARSSVTGSNNTFCNPYFVIKSDGTVGVNCLSPTSTLTVGGTSRYGGEATFEAAMTGTSACFSSFVCSSILGSTRLFVCGGSSNNYLASTNNEVLRLQSFCPTGMYATFYSGSTAIGDIGTPCQIFSSGNTTGFGINARGSANLEFGTLQSQKLVIFSTGESCFTGAVRMSCLVSVGTVTGTSATFTVNSGANLTLVKGTGAGISFQKTNATAQEWLINPDDNFVIYDITACSTTPFKIAKTTGQTTIKSTTYDVAVFNSTYGQSDIVIQNNGNSFAVFGSGISVASTAAVDDVGIGTAGLVKNIVFATGVSYTERMRVTSGGDLYVGTICQPGAGSSCTGVGLSSSGAILAQRNAATVMYIGRGTNDGELAALYQGTTQNGAIGVANCGMWLGSGTSGTERLRITCGGTIKQQSNQAIGACLESGTIVNNSSVSVNLNGAGGNNSIGFVAIGVNRPGTNCGTVRMWSQYHTQNANTYCHILGNNEGGITITNNSNGGETITNCSGGTVNYVIRYLNIMSQNAITELT